MITHQIADAPLIETWLVEIPGRDGRWFVAAEMHDHDRALAQADALLTAGLIPRLSRRTEQAMTLCLPHDRERTRTTTTGGTER